MIIRETMILEDHLADFFVVNVKVSLPHPQKNVVHTLWWWSWWWWWWWWLNLGGWDEVSVKTHQETSLANAVDDHRVVHLDFDSSWWSLCLLLLDLNECKLKSTSEDMQNSILGFKAGQFKLMQSAPWSRACTGQGRSLAAQKTQTHSKRKYIFNWILVWQRQILSTTIIIRIKMMVIVREMLVSHNDGSWWFWWWCNL